MEVARFSRSTTSRSSVFIPQTMTMSVRALLAQGIEQRFPNARYGPSVKRATCGFAARTVGYALYVLDACS